MFRANCAILTFFILSAISSQAGDTGHIKAFVTDSVTGEPIPNMKIDIGRRYGCRTNLNGEILMTDIFNGIYTVVLTSKEYERKELSDIKIFPDSTTILDISLSRRKSRLEILSATKKPNRDNVTSTGSLKGEVYHTSFGRPLKEVTIQLRGTSLRGVTDINGEFHIENIPPGSYDIITSRLDFLNDSMPDFDIYADFEYNLRIGLIYYRTRSLHGPMPIRHLDKPIPKLISPAFENGDTIPRKYTCDGANIPPPFEVSSLPDKTKSLVLICDTLTTTSRRFIHWIVYNIPPDISLLPEGLGKSTYPDVITKSGKLKAIQGTNDSGEISYSGPCPQADEVQTYFFRIYALDRILRFSKYKMKSGIDFDELSEEMKGHVLGESVLMGRYLR